MVNGSLDQREHLGRRATDVDAERVLVAVVTREVHRRLTRAGRRGRERYGECRGAPRSQRRGAESEPTTNSPVFAPAFVKARPVRFAVPMFLTVKVCAALLLPTGVFANTLVPALSVRSETALVVAPVKTAISGVATPVP